MASELLKILVSCLSFAQKEGSELENQLMICLVELLVLYTQPTNDSPSSTDDSSHESSQALKALVGKMMTLLASSQSGPAFRQSLLSLPATARQALQVNSTFYQIQIFTQSFPDLFVDDSLKAGHWWPISFHKYFFGDKRSHEAFGRICPSLQRVKIMETSLVMKIRPHMSIR